MLLSTLILLGCLDPNARESSDQPGPGGGAGGSELLGLGLAPNDPIVSIGETVEFEVKAYYADTTYAIITDQILWVSTEPRVADFKGGPVATALSEGVSDIIATFEDGVSAKVELTVVGEGVEVTQLAMSPTSLEIREGEYAQLSAIATYSDGTSGNLAGSCDWSSDDTGVAAVDDAGGVTGRGKGDTTVRASCDGYDVQAPVAVLDEDAQVSPADLKVTRMEVAINGYDVEYTVSVENIGGSGAAGFYVDLYLDHYPDFSGEDYDGYAYVASLAAGANIQALVDLEGLSAGSYGSYTLVDPEGASGESNTQNNLLGPLEFTVESPTSAIGPELTITYFDGATDGDYTLYEMEIANIGDTTAYNFWIDLYYDTGTPDVCEEGDLYAFVEELGPGEYAAFEADVDDGPSWYWSWDSALVVDSCDDVAESNEGNNIAWITLEP